MEVLAQPASGTHSKKRESQSRPSQCDTGGAEARLSGKTSRGSGNCVIGRSGPEETGGGLTEGCAMCARLGARIVVARPVLSPRSQRKRGACAFGGSGRFI